MTEIDSFTPSLLFLYTEYEYRNVKKSNMATPFKNPRDGILYFRREVPEKLRAAFDGKREVKVSLGTRDPAEAKAPFARENAKFEELLADARRRAAEGTLILTPGGAIRRWCEAPAIGNGLSGPQRLILTFMELDAAAGARYTASSVDMFPPPMFGPASNINWPALLADKKKFEEIVESEYAGNLEQAGTNWIRTRWHDAEKVWSKCLAGPIQRLREFETSVAKFSDEEIAKALLELVDTKRPGDEAFNRARLGSFRPRRVNSRLRPNMRLKQLFREWQEKKKPRPQTALEYEAAIDDFIDYAGDIAVSQIDTDLIYDYRDEAALLPASMPRLDRSLPFRERVAKHSETKPKCATPTLKKRVGALQALLSYAFKERLIAANVGAGVVIVESEKKKNSRRSFEDHEIGKLFSCPLFVDPLSWNSKSRTSDATIFWLFLLGVTTGARLEEVGQAALADVKRDGTIAYLDIDEYVVEEDADDKSVKNRDSVRLIPIHAKLVELGFIEYCDALAALGHTQLFPDLQENKVGKRTKEASQKINRIIDRYVDTDRRLVFHSLRHAFKSKGHDAGLADRTLDQICGHAPVSTGGRYGSSPRIRTIHRDLHKIDFSCIDWDTIALRTKNVVWSAILAG